MWLAWAACNKFKLDAAVHSCSTPALPPFAHFVPGLMCFFGSLCCTTWCLPLKTCFPCSETHGMVQDGLSGEQGLGLEIVG